VSDGSDRSRPAFDTVWARIVAHEGEVFKQIRGREFTFEVASNVLRLSTTNHHVSRATVEEAFQLIPLANTTPLQHLRAPSYLYAILMDQRIRQTDW